MGADVFDASNNWAVSGSRSVTGKPLLANDMHLGLNVPGIWMQMHQVYTRQTQCNRTCLTRSAPCYLRA